jgi:hypothetical protein
MDLSGQMCDVAEAYEQARLFIRKKKKLMSQKTADAFIKNIYLVLIGVRDAYMFENFSCDDSMAHELVENMLRIFCVSKKVIIIIMETLDVIVLLEECFSRKREWIVKRSNLPVIIDVTCPDPIVCLKLKCEHIWANVLTLMARVPDGSEGVTLFYPPTDVSVGSVLFAGWCLGYPFLYHYIPLESAGEVGCTALSMQSLVKVSMVLDMQPMAGAIAHPFMDFTIPSDCISSCLHEFDTQYESLEALLDSKITQIQLFCTSSSATTTALDSFKDSIRYEITEFQLPYVML